MNAAIIAANAAIMASNASRAAANNGGSVGMSGIEVAGWCVVGLIIGGLAIGCGMLLAVVL